MPKFFINFRNANKIVAKDEIGIDVPGLKEARAAAIASAREIVADNVKEGAITPLDAVIVTDESGRTLMTILAKDVLPDPLK